MATTGIEQEPIEVEQRLLISATSAAKLVGVHRSRWPAIAEANGIQPVPSGRGRNFWRRLEVERLVAPGSPVKDNT